MKQVVLVLGGLGILVGVIMLVMGANAREINLDLVIYGFLTAVVSLTIAFVARIIISQRS